MFMGSGHVKPGEFDAWLEARRRRQQRLDRERPHELLDQRAVERARARAVPRIRSHGLSARHDDAARPSTPSATSSRTSGARASRTSRTASREVVLGEMLYPGGPSVSLAGHRLHAGSHRRQLRRRRRRSSRRTTRRRTPAWSSPATSTRRRRAQLVEKWFGDVKPGARAEPMTIPGVALTGVQKKTITDRVQLPRLYLAWLTPRAFRAGRRGARRRRRRAGRRQELAALQAARLRHADRAGASARSRTRRRCRRPS